MFLVNLLKFGKKGFSWFFESIRFGLTLSWKDVTPKSNHYCGRILLINEMVVLLKRMEKIIGRKYVTHVTVHLPKTTLFILKWCNHVLFTDFSNFRLLLETKYRRLPVVDSDGMLVKYFSLRSLR